MTNTLRCMRLSAPAVQIGLAAAVRICTNHGAACKDPIRRCDWLVLAADLGLARVRVQPHLPIPSTTINVAVLRL